MGKEATDLLIILLKNQKGNPVPFQVVNNLNNNQPVDKVITQFEDILFAESDPDPEFDQKIEDKTIALGELLKKEK